MFRIAVAATIVPILAACGATAAPHQDSSPPTPEIQAPKGDGLVWPTAAPGVPTTYAAVHALLPAGWDVVRVKEGLRAGFPAAEVEAAAMEYVLPYDFDQDGKVDLALVMARDPSSPDANAGDRSLVILMQQDDGRLAPTLVKPNLLFSEIGYEDEPLSMSIDAAGQLHLDSDCGVGREAGAEAFTIAWRRAASGASGDFWIVAYSEGGNQNLDAGDEATEGYRWYTDSIDLITGQGTRESGYGGTTAFTTEPGRLVRVRDYTANHPMFPEWAGVEGAAQP